MGYTFSRAIGLLKSGQATKPENWRAYFMRTDNGVAEYDSTHTYAQDDQCKHDGRYYVCKQNNTTGTWDSSKWLMVNGANYVLEIVERDSTSAAISVSYLHDGTISWVFDDEEAQGYGIDGAFMKAMASDNWLIGSVADFEAVRGGSSGERW